MKRIRRIFVILMISVGLASSGLFLMYKSGLFKVVHLSLESTVDGDPLFEEHREKLQAVLNVRRGHEIWKVDVENLAEEIRRQSWIKTVRVQRIFPNSVRVSVTAKKVVAAVMTEKARVIPISEEAHLLPPLPTSKAPDVPLIRQKRFLKEAPLRQAAVQIVQQLPEEGELSQKTVSEISIDTKNNYWISLIQNDLTVKIGADLSSIPLKAARVEKVLDYLENNKMQARLIDADFSKKVIVKLKK